MQIMDIRNLSALKFASTIIVLLPVGCTYVPLCSNRGVLLLKETAVLSVVLRSKTWMKPFLITDR